MISGTATKNVAIVFLAIAVLLSGCSTGDVGETNNQPTAANSDDDIVTQTPSPTPTVNNPWNNKTVTVAVAVGESQALENGTVGAVEYWNTDGKEYATYPFEFEYIDNPGQADIIVRPVNHPLSCDEKVIISDTIGCAPVLSSNSTVREQITVKVVEGIPEPSALSTTKHELGHVLGLGHDDEPWSLMSYNSTLTNRQRAVINETNTGELEREIERGLNTYRAEFDVQRLESDPELRRIARNRAEELATEDDDQGMFVDPDLGLECQIELDGYLHLPNGDANLYATSLYRYQGLIDYINYSDAEYVAGPNDAVNRTISRWRVTADDLDRAEHYNRQGVGVYINDDGRYAAVRAIC